MRAGLSRIARILLAFAAVATSASAQGSAPPVSTLPQAEPATSEAEPLAPEETRVAIRAGGLWGRFEGSEVPQVDVAIGVEGEASFRLIAGFSVWGGFATSTHDVDGQIVQLLDQPLRPDGRSGRVIAEVQNRRFRVGFRIDGLREPAWRLHPYLVGAVTFGTTEVTVSSVDGRPPVPVPDPVGNPVDVSSFDEGQTGAMGRLGVEYRFASSLGADVHVSYEVVEFPPATHAGVLAGAGIVWRR